MTSGTLTFKLDWEKSGKPASRGTSARLSVFVDSEAVWPVRGAPNLSLDIQVDDLLAYLTEYWKPLVLRQAYPIVVNPSRPSLLRASAENRWSEEPTEVAEREDEIVCNFEDAHNVARCFAGNFDLPPLWLFRQGERLIVETQSQLFTVNFRNAYAELARLGDEIAEILIQNNQAKWGKAVDRWNARDVATPFALLGWSTNLSNATAEKFVSEGLLVAPASVSDAANDNDELKIAARMASALPGDQIRSILELVRRFEAHAAPQLDKLSEDLVGYIHEKFSEHRPYEQGEAAADFVRSWLQTDPHSCFDIASSVVHLGASLHLEGAEPDTLDALAVWGSKYGPAVFLNAESPRVDTKNVEDLTPQARVTLAHELCHLLLDRGHSLGAVDVLNSKMPRNVESRAKSFAGELLLPSTTAAEWWERAKSPKSKSGLEEVLKALQSEYCVTRSVAAWKLDHGLQRRDIDLTTLLDSIAPFR